MKPYDPQQPERPESAPHHFWCTCRKCTIAAKREAQANLIAHLEHIGPTKENITDYLSRLNDAIDGISAVKLGVFGTPGEKYLKLQFKLKVMMQQEKQTLEALLKKNRKTGSSTSISEVIQEQLAGRQENGGHYDRF